MAFSMKTGANLRLTTIVSTLAVAVWGGALMAQDTLTLGATLDMYGWNPTNQPGYQNWAADAVWDNLAKCDAVGALEPDIAESWEITDSNSTFVAHIRPGMTFTDGTPVNAETIIPSIAFIQTNGGQTNDYAGMTVEAVDEFTLRLAWPEPQAVLMSKICNIKIVAPASLTAGTWDAPVGSGPYVFDAANSTTGSVYTFQRNESHWNAAHYDFETLVIRVLENESAAVSALITGQIDATLVPLGSVATVQAEGLEVIAFQGQTPRLIISDRTGAVVPALGDVRVRQAMNMVFNKDEMAEFLYMGVATPTAQVFRPGAAAYIDGLADPYPFDVERARALMAEAGYADGFDLEFPTMPGQNFETLLPYVQQQLALINIRVTEVPLSGANAIGDLLSGQFPVVLWQLGNFGNSALQIYIESTPAGWWNLQHQPDDYVDSRYAEIVTATPERATALQQEINRYLIDNAWFAPFVLMGSNYAFRPETVSVPTQSDQEALTPRLRDFQQP